MTFACLAIGTWETTSSKDIGNYGGPRGVDCSLYIYLQPRVISSVVVRSIEDTFCRIQITVHLQILFL